MLNGSVRNIKGVGSKYSDIFLQNGIKTLKDLIMYFPKSYDFISMDSKKCVFEGTVVQILKDVVIRKNMIITTIKMESCNGEVAKLIYFNKPYMKHNFMLGSKHKVYGSFRKTKNYIELLNAEKYKEFTNDIIPRYNSIKGISNTYLINVIKSALNMVNIRENLPEKVIRKQGLISLNDAVINVHFPRDREHLERAINRFKYQELLNFFLKTRFMKKNLSKKKDGIKFKIFTNELIQIKESINFSLTDDQNKAIKQILTEQKLGILTNRLLQGDVGSGKTIVALISAFNVILNGYKVCMMVPTEILATQHYYEAINLFGKFGVNVKILVGSTKESEKRIIKEELKGDDPVFLIGTHAVLEEDVKIHKLGYIIFDEQHKFGVSQRSKLVNKSGNENCSILVMTATPIPRTLFLYIYSDMDISTIRQLPSNRKKVKTIHMKQEQHDSIYKILKSEIDNGGQCYIICPLIEDSENLDLISIDFLHKKLMSSILHSYNIGVLHGNMDNKTKNSTINSFKCRDIDILISTTVIEVGIDIPTATVMVIENAERFGLSQIHQLRGRIGRGNKEGLCILVTNSSNDLTKKRISTLVESNDGFYLSEQDLKIRGSGEIFGFKQHGDNGFVFADIMNDMDILVNVKKDIEYMDGLDDLEIYEFYNNVEKKLSDIDETICFN